MSQDELRGLMFSLGEPAYRAKQVYEWLHVHGAESWDSMKNIPAALKAKLSDTCEIRNASVRDVYISKIDGTRKYVLELNDGNLIESVAMRYNHGISVCISTEVGCPMGCKFCASTLGGKVRNLTPGEILGQVALLQRDLNERVSRHGGHLRSVSALI